MKRNRKPVPSRADRRISKNFSANSAEVLEQRVLLTATATATGVEPIGGTGNNVAHPTWGAAGNDLTRLTPAQYANGINSPSLPQAPSARLISNLVNSQSDPANPSQDIATVDKQSLSDFGYAFGQFMDHDMDLTQNTGASAPISVPVGDPIGGPNDTPLAFTGSQVDPATGTSKSNPAQQVNSISSYFDLSQVYGSDVATDNALRTMSGGQMKTSPGGLPPLDNTTYFTTAQLAAINAAEGGMGNDGPAPESQLYVTGDTRGNENVELTALQTLFLDNHNRIAAQLQKQHPNWTDEQLFQDSRKLNIAQYQSIIYNEYIPAVMGASALPVYKGYNPNVNASISNEFSTVAFRFGHSLLSGEIERAGNNGQAVAAQLPLEEDFFDPTILNGQGMASTTDPITGLASTDIGAILKADADGNSQAMDEQVINEVRNELFNEVVPGVGYGQDLIALDIQRGRDNGIGSYNEVRQSLGLPAVTSFSQITSNVQVQKDLQAAYGTVNDIDPIIGGMAEDHVAGSDVGPLFQAIMAKQFTNLRDGDRFFYLNESFNPAEQAILQQGSTLARLIEANTNITNLQSNVFLFQASISGNVAMNLGRGHSVGIPGITVQLKNSDGDVVATTTTNRQGAYTFTQLSGGAANVEDSSGVSGTGTYSVALLLPSWLKQTTANPNSILISRGGINAQAVNFSIRLNWNAQTGGVSGSTLQAVVSQLTAADSNSSQQTTTNNATTASAAAPTATNNTQTATPASTISTSSSPTTSTLLTFLESLPSSTLFALVNSADAGTGSSSSPLTTGDLDSAFHPAEFAKLADLLS